MSSEQLACPGCSGNLVAGQVEGLRQYVCRECGGVVVGIAVLRQLAGTAGQRIWTAEPAPPAGDPAYCPFCVTDMERKVVPTGAAAICKACEVVWLDKPATSSLPVRVTGSEGQPSLETEARAARCQECGAPIANTWDERCRYCGAAIHAPTKVVVLSSGDSDDQFGGGDGSGAPPGHTGLFGEVLRALARPVD
ncbi:MAG TPA: zf-TFIIB domain-containing protein [Acidimicrobiales bacterium]|nr:zf-TFIIB domain-containing protein [Acidimicrobiales bacterium]